MATGVGIIGTSQPPSRTELSKLSLCPYTVLGLKPRNGATHFQGGSSKNQVRWSRQRHSQPDLGNTSLKEVTPGCIKWTVSPSPLSSRTPTGVAVYSPKSDCLLKALLSSIPARSHFYPAAAHSPRSSHFLPHGHPQTVSQPKKLISHPATKSPPPPAHPPALWAAPSAVWMTPSFTHPQNTTVWHQRVTDGLPQQWQLNTQAYWTALSLSPFCHWMLKFKVKKTRRDRFSESRESSSDKAEGKLRVLCIMQPSHKSQMAITVAPGIQCRVSHTAIALDFSSVLFTAFLNLGTLCCKSEATHGCVVLFLKNWYLDNSKHFTPVAPLLFTCSGEQWDFNKVSVCYKVRSLWAPLLIIS